MPSDNNRHILTSVSCLGISMIMTQLLVLREFMQLFSGNELVIGIILGLWMVCTGLGSLIGKRVDQASKLHQWLLFGQITTAILPFLMVSAIRSARLLFVPGQVLGLPEIFYISLGLIMPYCLNAGFMLPLFSKLGSDEQNASQIGIIYVLDIVGDIIGGLLFCFLLVYIFTPFQILTFLLILNLLAAILVSAASCRRITFISLLLIASLTIIFTFDIEQMTGELNYKDQTVLYQKNTPYGFLTAAGQNNQITVYENNLVIGSSGDLAAAEEGVHFALSQHANPQNILMLGGGISGMQREIQKYNPAAIDYLELDPEILSLSGKLWPPEENSSLRLISQDPRQYIRLTEKTYDAILMSTAPPLTAQINRLYTVDFFKEAKSALNRDGIIGFSLDGSENYINPAMRSLIATLHKSLAEVFDHIIIIPGSRLYFMASDHPIDYDISAKLAARNIPTVYINDNYLKARLEPGRLSQIKQIIDVQAPLNTDLHPVSYLQGLRYWLDHFQENLLLPLIFIGLLSIVSAVLIITGPGKAINASLFSSGFAGMSLQVIILLVFQVSQGVIYQQIGLIFTAFLIGTAIGAACTVKIQKNLLGFMAALDLSIGLLGLLMGSSLFFKSGSIFNLRGAAPFLLLPGLTLFIGFLVGGQLPIAAGLNFNGVGRTSSKLYSLDYLGAALGALLVTIFAVPQFGLAQSCLLLGIIKIISGSCLFIKFPARSAAKKSYNSGQWSAPLLTMTFFGIIGISTGLNISMPAVYALSFSTPYHLIIFALLLSGMAYAFFNLIPGVRNKNINISNFSRLDNLIYKTSRLSIFRWLNYLVLSLAVFFPIFRCYFKIPYLFCHVCPRRCIFGFLRPFLIPAALIMNLEKRFWCFQACPIGTLSDSQTKNFPPVLKPRIVNQTSFLIIILTSYTYFKINHDFNQPVVGLFDWYNYLFFNAFKPSGLVIIAAFLLIAANYLSRRFFCNYLCPVGAASRLMAKIF